MTTTPDDAEPSTAPPGAGCHRPADRPRHRRVGPVPVGPRSAAAGVDPYPRAGLRPVDHGGGAPPGRPGAAQRWVARPRAGRARRTRGRHQPAALALPASASAGRRAARAGARRGRSARRAARPRPGTAGSPAGARRRSARPTRRPDDGEAVPQVHQRPVAAVGEPGDRRARASAVVVGVENDEPGAAAEAREQRRLARARHAGDQEQRATGARVGQEAAGGAPVPRRARAGRRGRREGGRGQLGRRRSTSVTYGFRYGRGRARSILGA